MDTSAFADTSLYAGNYVATEHIHKILDRDVSKWLLCTFRARVSISKANGRTSRFEHSDWMEC